jgi:hypothetical protein
MFMVNPSGYWGAIKKMNHTGKKKVVIRLRDAIAMIILEGKLILFILLFFKAPGGPVPHCSRTAPEAIRVQ